MAPLLRLRSERDSMSAIERRIADFILDNAHLLRDYSSQQLASALGISQSSVVKFSQKIGFKGYPDLKFSVGEALARSGQGDAPQPLAEQPADDFTQLEESLRRSKIAAQEETRLVTPREALERAVALLDCAGTVYVCGLGEDGLCAREFALRLSLLGMVTVHQTDPVLMMASLSSSRAGDVLVLFSEHGKRPELSQVGRQFQDGKGKVVSLTRHTSNPLRAHADVALLVSAHDPVPCVEQLLYRHALQELLDFVYVLLCHGNADRRKQLDINLERMRHMIHS